MIKNKKGYSVLEIVLTLGIASGIAYTAFSFYLNEKHDAAVRETVQQVRTIFDTADAYLMSAKPDGSVQETYPISMQILKNTLAFPLNLGELREGSEAEVAASTAISTSASKSASMSASLSTSKSASTSVSVSASKSISSSISSSVSASKSASVSASLSTSTSTSLSASKSASTSQSLSASTSHSLSASQSASISASKSASTSARLSASKSASTSASLSASRSASVSASTSASLSASKSVSTSSSISTSLSISQGAAENKTVPDIEKIKDSIKEISTCNSAPSPTGQICGNYVFIQFNRYISFEATEDSPASFFDKSSKSKREKELNSDPIAYAYKIISIFFSPTIYYDSSVLTEEEIKNMPLYEKCGRGCKLQTK
ncbi:hypothetical protein ACFFL1_07865 [Samsonia erythrinae]|uniref:Uncharacterized protein n=1 Tax=Samsonia erythrinae TaxID=160434 RepID=A0A4R3VQX0_9GAMM|nr:hypothetical protein [Samsonia erythrinae]TCV07125.1 hypothetical protein EDC54_103385 [Samsonia erythrinae]